MTLSGGQWVIDKQVAGRRIFRRTGTADLETALHVYAREVVQLEQSALDLDWRTWVEDCLARPNSWLHRAQRRMEIRGRMSGKGCSMTLDQAALVLLRSNGRCELTGIRFSDMRYPNTRVAPYAASFDRIDSSRGYHCDNCRVVCTAVNMAMGAWGAPVLARIGESYVLTRLLRSLDHVNRADEEF